MTRPALLIATLAAVLSMPLVASANTGSVGFHVGALSIDQGGDTGYHPHARAEIAFSLIGPLELGGYLQLGANSFPADGSAFGGGATVLIRPSLPLGLRPVAFASAGRTAIPADMRVSAWDITVGGGLGVDLGSGFILEGRVAHHWYLNIPSGSNVGDNSWAFTAGLTYELP